ncbi:hypothetical protein [Daejeonella oryzae]|uniref:hypothetical protein n=1 Tax=Daejeonella oryzae TaxID=1122943 RepID=UPI0003F56015|nr:hypothetical protein [Daejeonella oryzae]
MNKMKLFAFLLLAGFSITSCTSTTQTDNADSTAIDAPMPDTASSALGADTSRNDSMLVDSLNQ